MECPVKNPTLILLVFLAPTLALASGGHGYIEQPDMFDCHPLKKNFKELEITVESSKAWHDSAIEARTARTEFFVACDEAQAQPNAPGQMQKFEMAKQKVLGKYEEMKKNAAKAKQQFSKVYKPLKDLGAKVCEKQIREGHKIVDDQTKAQVAQLTGACKISGERTASR